MSRGIRVALDESGTLPLRPIRLTMRDGLYVNVVQRLTAHEARELVTELERALAQIAENHETRARITPIVFSNGGTD